MSGFRFLLDENVNPALRDALHRQMPELIVWIIGDPAAPPYGAADPDILRWCEDHNFSMITNNRASMPLHLSEHLAEGRHVPGIFILNPGRSIGAIVEEIMLVCGASKSEEYRDRLIYLPIT